MRGGSGIKTQVRQVGVPVMAWASLALAIVGGAALTATFVSDWLVGGFGLLGKWAHLGAIVILVVEVVWLVRDLVMDGIPNYPALIVCTTAPTVARVASGKLSTTIRHWSHQAMTAMGSPLGDWLGTGKLGSGLASLTLAAATLAAAYVLAQRVVGRSAGSPAR